MLLKLRVRVGDFVKRAGTIIFVVTIILWALMRYPRPEAAPDLDEKRARAVEVEHSFAGRVGKAFEPVIAPLGFDWRIGVGLIGSFAAREVFVATMGTVYSLGEEEDEKTQAVVDMLLAKGRAGDRKEWLMLTGDKAEVEV